MTIHEVELSKIIPYKKNAKKHPEKQVEQIANSIKTFGWKQPLVLDKNGVIIIGHGRLEAAKLLNAETVPCVYAEDLTEEQTKALRLADNRLNESDWDFVTLQEELSELENVDMGDFGLDLNDEWFQRALREGDEHEEGNEEYNAFVDKFKPKKTTDDCYTPENVYDVVAEWVAKEFNLKRKNFLRPFRPGGDYQKEAYGKNAVVVDNPPFSILAEIMKWYEENNVKYFLFAPALTLVSSGTKRNTTFICVGAEVTYENGATVGTSFVTNLDPIYRLRTEPELYKKIKEENDKNLKEGKTELPNYLYPDNVIVAGQIQKLSKYGQELKVKKCECVTITELDEQKKEKKGIFGNGLLLSEKAAAEKAAAEKAAAEKAAAEKAAARKWQLSEREKAMIAELGRSDSDK